MRRLAFLLSLVVLLLGLGTLDGASAAEDPLATLHPSPKAVPGLVPSGKTRYAAGGEGLADLYNGGYERYLAAGVLSASQRFYELSGVTCELTVHAMKDAKAAATFLQALCKDIKASPVTKPALGTASSMCLGGTSGSSFGFLAVGSYLYIASLDAENKSQLEKFLAVAGGQARKSMTGEKPKGRDRRLKSEK